MNIRGCVKNGVVVLDEDSVLPEGAVVTVSCPDNALTEANGGKERIRLPLVPSDRLGSVSLTAEHAAELLDEADVSA